MLGEALCAVPETNPDNETGPAHPAFPSRFRTNTANARTNETRRGLAVNSGQPSQSLPFGVSDLFVGALAN